MILPVLFLVLIVATLAVGWRRVLARSKDEWIVDLTGLAVQGFVIPLVQTAVLAALLSALLPAWRGVIRTGFAGGFFLCFVGVDYVYYWNHRLLHGWLWRWHAVHHSATTLDVFVTSRNTLWTPLLIVYVWANGTMLMLLDTPAGAGYLAAITATAGLDLWRHSPLRLPPPLTRVAALLFVTPHEHAWHHSSSRTEVNFGANLTIWDRLHGTFHSPNDRPERLGIVLRGSLMRQFVVPSADVEEVRT